VPWLNLAYDGLEQCTTDTRLEAFLYQAKQHKEEKQDKKDMLKKNAVVL
jgi:hypothetical protein